MGSTVTVTLADGRRFERHENSGLLEPGELAGQIHPPDPRRSRRGPRRRPLSSGCNGSKPNPTSPGSAP